MTGRLIKAAAVLLLILLLCGCSNVQSILAGAAARTGEEPEVSVSPEASYVPDVGGTVSLPIPAEPDTIDPMKAKNAELANFFTLIYEPLIRLSVDGRPEASLAETWSLGDDGVTWSFKLRENVAWHNGSVLTTADVGYTLDYLITLTDEESPYADFNDIFVTYEIIDEFNFTVTTTDMSLRLLYRLDFPILCQAYYASGNDIDIACPVGTGAYVLEAYQPNETLTLTVNEKWWRAAPYITTVRAVPMESSGDRLALYQSGTIDVVTTPQLTATQYRQYETTTVADYMTQYYDCLMTNVRGSLSDVRIRKAIAHALDKSEMISSTLMSHGVACDIPLPPDSWLYDGKYAIYEYNLGRANDYLDSAGLDDWDGDGVRERQDNKHEEFTLKFLALQSDKTLYLADVAEYIARKLAEVGVATEMNMLPWEEYAAALSAGEYDIALVSYYLERDPDPQYLTGSAGKGNVGGYADADMDAILADCYTAVEESDIREAYDAFAEKFTADLPHIPLYFRTNSLVYDNTIRGVTAVRADSIYHGISGWYMLVRQGQ